MSTFNDLITFTRSTTATYLDSVVFGTESIINGDFSDGLTGWSTSNTNATNTITVNNGAVTMVGDGTVSLNLKQENVFTVNKEYRLTVDATVNAGNVGGIKLQYSGNDSSIGIIQESGQYSFTFKPTTTTLDIFRQNGGEAINITIDNISVKEVIGGQGTAGIPMLRTAASNEPRLEYDASGNALGLLVEEARTNHLFKSQAFDDAYWNKHNTSATANQIVAPDGTSTGLKVNESADNANHYIHRTGFSFTLGEQWTQSLYAKAGTNNIVQLLGTSTAFGSQQWANFDLSDGTIGSKGNVTEASIQSVGGGWYRCSITVTATATASGSGFFICLVPTKTSSRVYAYEGNPSNYIYAWGSQLELGAFSTSYIPTVASTLTRTTESVRVTLSDFYYRQKHGTIVIEFTSKYDESVATYHRPWELGNLTTGANRIFMYVTGDETKLLNRLYDNSVDQFQGTLTTELPNNTGVYSKAAMAWQPNDAQTAYNGADVDSNTSVTLTQERDTLAIMGRTSNTDSRLSGHVKSIQYYPLRLVEERLEQVTA